MKILVVTEKHHASTTQRDGGSRVIDMFNRLHECDVDVVGFQLQKEDSEDAGNLVYPCSHDCRFERRLLNASFIRSAVAPRLQGYDAVVFVHTSMMFGFKNGDFNDIRTVLFPMFTTPAYTLSGEDVPEEYRRQETRVVRMADCIITPSVLEQEMLIELGADPSMIHIIARGVDAAFRHHLPEHKAGDGPLKCVSLGSIKRQKNPLGVVAVFRKILEFRPNSTLRFIGPIQDEMIASALEDEVIRLGLTQCITIQGHVPPSEVANHLAGSDVHISASKCETFGRAILETCAMGIPNIVVGAWNAAGRIMSHRAGLTWVPDLKSFDALAWLGEMTLMERRDSLKGVEDVFDLEFEQHRISSVLTGARSCIVTDFDGTLYHKDDSVATKFWVDRVNQFDVVVVCSARPVMELTDILSRLGVDWDVIVGYSGAVLRDGSLHDSIVSDFQHTGIGGQCIRHGSTLLQVQIEDPMSVQSLRVESYGTEHYAMPWQCTKLRGAVLALKGLKGIGQVRAYGDGLHDAPMVEFFGGEMVKNRGGLV